MNNFIMRIEIVLILVVIIAGIFAKSYYILLAAIALTILHIGSKP